MKNLEDFITTYKDFPKKGVAFKDVLEVLQEPVVFRQIILKMSSSQLIRNSEAIISIDARGFIFGAAIALQTSKPMIFARKPGKLPGEIVKENYNLEYGQNSISIQKKALKRYSSFVIIDDLLATGGTAACVAKLLKKNNRKISGLLTVVELIYLRGREKLEFPVETIITL
tara:strand:+ start:545 stop:1057 length:513 start_codon:yes stop_codon:yes gene_type:complete